MQKTDRHKAVVMAASFHLVGYSKPSSSSATLACELRLDAFSLTMFFSSAIMGSAMCAAGAVEGMTLSTTPCFSMIEGSWLWIAVFSELAELAMVDGLKWLFVSGMWVGVTMRNGCLGRRDVRDERPDAWGKAL
jgi:hypothetical protein